MAVLLPSSRGTFRVRVSPFDVFWAVASPLFALYFRDAYILSPEGAKTALLYCGLSFACTLIAFLAFRVGDGISRYFSVHDAISVLKAALVAGLTTSLVLFTITRLEGIPRSTPVLQVLILAAGLLTARYVLMLFDKERQIVEYPDHSAVEHIIMIGSTRLTSLFIKLLHAYSPAHRNIIAVLDDDRKLLGRVMCGVPVASLQQLDLFIEEFAVHGVHTDRVIIGGDERFLSAMALNHVRHICEQRQISLDFVPRLIGFSLLPSARHSVPLAVVENPRGPTAALPPYVRFKRLIDFTAAFAGIVILLPLFLIISLLILFDLGSPVVFWQRRIGQDGRSFLLYKFRTLRPPFDQHGRPARDSDRISWIGRLLRRTRLDELPQLFNVLVGEMSLIGPRPLLPCDQPTNSNSRLMVPPGITGWAQINGGNLVTPEEKGALDDWYVNHASLWLDLRIVLSTLRFLFAGERRSEQALSKANILHQANERLKKHQANERLKKPKYRKPDMRKVGSVRKQPPHTPDQCDDQIESSLAL